MKLTLVEMTLVSRGLEASFALYQLTNRDMMEIAIEWKIRW